MHYVLVKDRQGRFLGQLEVNELTLADMVPKETPYVSTDVLQICAIIAKLYFPTDAAYVEDASSGEIAIASARSPT